MLHWLTSTTTAEPWPYKEVLTRLAGLESDPQNACLVDFRRANGVGGAARLLVRLDRAALRSLAIAPFGLGLLGQLRLHR